ncbi:PAS domain-containing protein [Streptomyces sp. WMMC897]|uniref:PAS domain-containing protein n=1 Tax=Streptomyces sp. WMMC897 TaxID=3014782 RepID=UPI0022B6DE47|nr:PAS domain-containing protein [Streptomyces sp. WMMC897]MCZ7417554.1 PAS domain-containing protein [Streptomyces sp. WMMC897]
MSSRPSRGAARLAAILDALPDALLLVNANGTVVNANSIALETFEAPGTALIGRGLLDLLPAFDSKRIPGSMRRPEEQVEGRQPPTRMVARRTDGSEFPVEVTSTNLADGRTPYESAFEAAYADHGNTYTGDELLMLVVRDLTGTLDTEAELARQQRQTEMILRAAAEGVVGTDVEGRVVLVNPAAASLLGYRASDLGGQELHPLVHHSRADGSPLPYEETPLADTLRSGRKHRVRNQVLWTKDRRPVPVDLTTAPVRDGDQLVGAVLTFTDRSPFDALEARHEQLRAVLGDGLRGPLEELRRELSGLTADPAGQLWPEANQVLHYLSAGYARMTTLLDNVVAFQELEAGREKLAPEQVALDSVVSAGVEGAVELIGPGRVQFAVHAPPIQAVVDPRRLSLAIAHLVADVAGVDSTGNAVGGGTGGATVVVAAAKRGKGPDAVIRIEVRGPYPGGSPVHQPVVRGVVARHGGVLQTHELPGDGVNGSAFVLEVPVGDVDESLAPAAAEPPRTQPEPAQAPPEPAQAPPEPAQAPPEPAQAPPEPAQAPPEPAQAPPEPGQPQPEPGAGPAAGPDGAVPPTPTGRRARRALRPPTEEPSDGVGQGMAGAGAAGAVGPGPGDTDAPGPAAPGGTGAPGEAAAGLIPEQATPAGVRPGTGRRGRRARPEPEESTPVGQPGAEGARTGPGPDAGPGPGTGPGPGAGAGAGADAGAGPEAGFGTDPDAGAEPQRRAAFALPPAAADQAPMEQAAAGHPAVAGRPATPPVADRPTGRRRKPSPPEEAPPPAEHSGTPGHGSPAHGSPAPGAPFPGTPGEGTPVPGTPTHGAPASGAPVQASPRHGTPAHGTPGHDGPAHGAVPGTPGAGDGQGGTPASSGMAALEPARQDPRAAHPVVASSPILGGAAPAHAERSAPHRPSLPAGNTQAEDTSGSGISVRTLGQGVPFARPAVDEPAAEAPAPPGATAPPGVPAPQAGAQGSATEAAASPHTPAAGTGRRRKLAAPPPEGERASSATPPQGVPHRRTPAAPESNNLPAPTRPHASAPAAPHQAAAHPAAREFAVRAPEAGADEGPEPLDGPNGAVEVRSAASGTPPRPIDVDDELPPEPLDNPRRLLVWPEPDVSTQQALSERGYRPVIVHSRDEVDAQMAAYPAALFVDPLTGPITRTALQSLRQAAVAAEVPVLVTAGLGQASREAAYGADPAVLLKALAPRDSEQHPPRVLLVEEQPAIAEAFKATLERRGMQVTHAPSDSEAAAMAGQVRPNLVVMDLRQVRRRRAGVLDWLRVNGQLNRTPFVVYTSAPMDPSELELLATGETVLFLAERSTSPDVQNRIVDLLAKIGAN